MPQRSQLQVFRNQEGRELGNSQGSELREKQVDQIGQSQSTKPAKLILPHKLTP